MERNFGISLDVRVAEQLQRVSPAAASSSPQPLPAGTAAAATPASVGITDQSPLTFLLTGDTGGVEDPNPQKTVATAMQARAASDPKPAFLYIVGDVVYFYGDETDYAPQFYEPYTHLTLPIVAIPGNHDGDISDDTSRKPLDAFMENFCAPEAVLPSGSNAEYGRDLQTQPYCDWTLNLGELTIVGVYDNVPEGGHLYDNQISWLEGELKAAPTDRPLVVILHHPPYSVDAFHGGSATLGTTLDSAFSAAARTPELVISGHVHDYQRFTRTLNGKQVTYLVAGNGGYHNLHAFAKDAKPGEQVASGVTFEAGDDQNWGFVTFTAGGGKLSASYTSVTKDGQTTEGVDTWSVSVS